MSTELGQWTKEVIAGHKCHLYEPRVPNGYGQTILYLHGTKSVRMKRQTAVVREIEKHGLRIIEPEGEYSWWVDRISSQFDPVITGERFLLDYVMPFLAERWDCRPPQIGLLGASMGGQGALRLAYKYPNQFPVTAAVFPAIDFQKKIDEGYPALCEMYEDTEDARQDTATLHIHPLNWPRHQFFCCDPADVRWHESADRLHMKLFSLGVPHELDLETTAGGHSWAYFTHMAPRIMEFIAKGLESERLRVV